MELCYGHFRDTQIHHPKKGRIDKTGYTVIINVIKLVIIWLGIVFRSIITGTFKEW